MRTNHYNPMKKFRVFYMVFFALVIASLSYEGCSDLATDIGDANPVNGAHPDGWVSLSSSSFHGKFIAENAAWNLDGCKQCHGVDYRGGNTGSSCYTCHTSSQGPEECSLCHGGNGNSFPPKALNGSSSTSYIGVGVHAAHLDSTKWSAKVECNECHMPFSSFDDTLHIGNNSDGIAEVVFGSLARNSIGGNITPDPVWNRNDTKCSNTYCHGTFKNGNVNATANWVQPESVNCGTCHGNPATQNPNPMPNGVYVSPHFSYWTVSGGSTGCYLCHNQVIDSNGVFVDKSKHINGIVNFNEFRRQ